MRKYSAILLLCLINWPLSSMVWAHSGSTNSAGCHNNRQTGDYHCHNAGVTESVQTGAITELPALSKLLENPIATLDKLVVKPENRCSEYRRSDYSYPQSVEVAIISRQGGIFSLYTRRQFATRYETDIEHIVATSEAHDSGACRWSVEQRRLFARDLDNLTLASPRLNRHAKKAKDFAEWQPPFNKCWMAAVVVKVKHEYNLTVDQLEYSALNAVLSECN